MKVTLVAAGKGGVGKSRILCNLAKRMSWQVRVGILDADIDGPDVLMYLGAEGKKSVVGADHRLQPVDVNGIKVMSTSAIFKESDTGAAWGSEKKERYIMESLTAAWGGIDHLLVDCPAGIAEQVLALIDRLELTGAVIVATPDPVSQLDASKILKLFSTLKVPITGVVENMAFYTCSHCGQKEPIFGSNNVEHNLAARYGVEFLGMVPYYPMAKGMVIPSDVLDRLAQRLMS